MRTHLLSRTVPLLSVCLVASLPTPSIAERDYTVEELLAVKRISDIEVSPDGSHVAFTVTTADLEGDKLTPHIWILPLDDASKGGEPRQLTNAPRGESSPRWSPDSRHVAFVSSRGGSRQIWRIPLGGGEATQVTSISTGAGSPEWSPSGSHIAFLSDVRTESENPDIEARVIDHLLYRHWDRWIDGRRTHLFLVPSEGGEARDLTPGDSNVLGGTRGYSFSPDGRQIAFTRGPVDPSTGSSADIEAWSTNADVWVVSTEGGDANCLTSGNEGWDGSPEWSPDGRLLAYRSQKRNGYESDRFRLAILEPSTGRGNADLASDLDRSAREIVWAPDSRRIYFGAEHEGGAAVFAVELEGLERKGSCRWVAGSPREPTFSKISLPGHGRFLIGGSQTLTRPVEVGVTEALPRSGDHGATRLVTGLNEALIAELRLPSVESIRCPGARGRQIQAWLLKPPGYDPARRYPFVLFIHGGPQGAWSNTFHYRWNLALFAARGFVVLAPNPHGSTGFGQELTEQISGDWGGACYEDLLKAVDWALARGLADPERLAAMGGSFGGYMVNWILGHTDRFQCLVSHAGVYNLESMYGATEELWFPEWDLGGTPWDHDGCYEEFSPHRFAANFRTPTLVIHGQLDYRVPVTEGMQLFTALKRQGVDARFLYYPDEGHFVQKPKNSKLWNDTAMEWLEKYLSD